MGMAVFSAGSICAENPQSTVKTSLSSGNGQGTWIVALSALSAYLKATTNCQATNSKVVATSKSIVKNANATTSYTKAVAIFNWVRDKIGYSSYSNTRYGALRMLSVKKGNCVDTTHLLIALERASGIPARYVHGKCRFSSGTSGHVWAEVYVNGKWYKADAVSSRNSFGTMNNCKILSIYSKSAALKF
ncbi:Transglutaminase domain-containing protein [Methanobacterium congolense]|uniref:Transglutaminase domain-containing protein n=2 Tax=Methanobacterium congolense TaxID=118062 RepID=A0A1D3L084_9EURY|nr:Transglutaminase domain-containing protein [Methanobacterium congolense]